MILGLKTMMKFKAGGKHQIHKGLGKPYEIHILAVIDGNQIVYKWYGLDKQWWHYEVKRADILEKEIEHALEYNAS